MVTLDTLKNLPPVSTEVEILHPVYNLPLQGTIAIYTCSEDFEHPDGVNVATPVGVIDCRLSDVEVR